jgi:hypothetical protein
MCNFNKCGAQLKELCATLQDETLSYALIKATDILLLIDPHLSLY